MDVSEREALYREGLKLMDARRWSEAVGILSKVVKEGGPFPEAERALVEVSLRLLRGDDVGDRFARGEGGTEAEVLHALGTDSIKHGSYSEAARLIRRALELNPADPVGRMDLGEALVRSGQFEEAVQVYRGLAESNPWSSEGGRLAALPDYFLGTALAKAGSHDQAVTWLRHALEKSPALLETYGVLGLCLQRLGRLDEARAAFSEVLRRYPRYLEYWPIEFEGQFFYSIGEIRDAYEAVQSAC